MDRLFAHNIFSLSLLPLHLRNVLRFTSILQRFSLWTESLIVSIARRMINLDSEIALNSINMNKITSWHRPEITIAWTYWLSVNEQQNAFIHLFLPADTEVYRMQMHWRRLTCPNYKTNAISSSESCTNSIAKTCSTSIQMTEGNCNILSLYSVHVRLSTASAFPAGEHVIWSGQSSIVNRSGLTIVYACNSSEPKLTQSHTNTETQAHSSSCTL